MVGSIYYGTLFFFPQNKFLDWPTDHLASEKKKVAKELKEKNKFPANFFSFFFPKKLQCSLQEIEKKKKKKLQKKPLS